MKNLIKSALLLLALLLPATATAYDFEVDGIYYDINGNEAIVTYESLFSHAYSGDVTIPETVTYDGTNYSVTAIGHDAFTYCSGLTSVTIPNSVTSIGYSAFSYCSGLTNMTIPNSITSINSVTFSHCSGLTSLTIPNSVTTIGIGAFENCSGLTSVTIPNSVTTIGKGAFSYCSGLTSVTIPNTVTAIEYETFQGCSSLTSVTIPTIATSIGESAFAGCSSIESVTIPNSVTYIGNAAFAYCSGLINIFVESGNTTYDSRNNCNAIIETASNTLLTGCQNTVIPYSVTSIGNSAFSGCNSMTSVDIPNSVTTIGNYAFDRCSNLTSVNIGNSVTTIGNYAFRECTSMTNIAIPNSVTSIGEGAFYGCTGLTSVTIPNSISTICDGTFSGCTGLTNVTIPNSVTSIGEMAFHDCSGMTSVTIPNSVITIGDHAFFGCYGLTNLTIGNSVTAIGYETFTGCSGLSNVTIPNSVTSIGYSAFEGCSGLTSLTIPNSVTIIRSGAFAYCSGLTNIVVESGNSTYDSRNDCNAIIETESNTLIAGCQNTVILNSVTAIGGCAFAGCSGLTSVTIPNSVSKIYREAFRNCDGLTNIIIPNSVTYIGNVAFDGCSNLKNLTIPNSVIQIDWIAFTDCNGLTDVYSYITNPSKVARGENLFCVWLQDGDFDYSGRTLHVPVGTAEAYQANLNWYPFFGQIVEDLTPDYLPGDVNGDGEVNIADINALMDIILGGDADDVTLIRADVNSDGEIGIADFNALIDIILGGEVPTIPDGHEYVDLGLPSGTLWATCNIGANSPEEYGDYFAWGETEPKEVFVWSTYKWCNGSQNTLTKYCTDSIYGTVDNKIELTLEDDAAFMNFGSSWRMPTLEQQEELRQHCTCTWTTVNGVNGQLFTGPNGNTLFLPASGYQFGNSLIGVGTYAYYWSRSLYSDSPCIAYSQGFGSGYMGWCGSLRSYGHTIRAVRASH